MVRNLESNRVNLGEKHTFIQSEYKLEYKHKTMDPYVVHFKFMLYYKIIPYKSGLSLIPKTNADSEYYYLDIPGC